MNKYDSDGQTPLHVFCSAGNLALVKLMVKFGASTKMRTREGWSVMHLAAFCGNAALLSFAIKCNKNKQ